MIILPKHKFQRQCEKKQCKNGGECILTNCNGPDCFRCKCTFQYKGKLCEEENGNYILKYREIITHKTK